MTLPVRRIYEFDSFRVDVAERKVFQNGENVVLTPKVFDILLVLLENRGNTVEKDEFIRRVWVDTYVEEGSLNRNISTLRKALGDDSNEQKLIKTLPRLGYRFTAQVDEFIEDASSTPKESTGFRRFSESPADTRAQKSNRRRLNARVLIALAIAGLCAVLAYSIARSRVDKTDLTGLTTFEQRQFEKFGSKNPDAIQAYVTGRSLWHRRSAEGLHLSIYHLERAIRIDPEFALAHSALADAYAFDTTAYRNAEQQALEAIRLNSNLGEPHATIGFVKMFWNWKLGEARESFRIATELSPDYATAHQWYAISLIASRQGGAGLAEIKRAVELEPRSVSINADLCQIYYFLEKYEEALTQCKKTLEIEPASFNASSHLYEILLATGRYDEAVEQFFRMEEVKSDFALPMVHKEQLRKAFSDGGIRSFWQTRAEYLEQIRSYYAVAMYRARLSENEKALAALRKASEHRDFTFVFVHTEPVFTELRADPAYKGLEDLVDTVNSR